ncbi:MAG: superoxide dismutase [Bacteroidetes bacterium]|nr:superoxide dismutase [Bacteroidota bacterium]
MEAHITDSEDIYTLPSLGYAYNALEPHIDAQTMEIHHTKHHQSYITKLNAAMSKEPSLKAKSLEQLLSSIQSLPESVRNDVRNHGGGHWNHSFFWTIIGPLKKKPSENLSAAIVNDFGSMEAFKEQFLKKSMGIFGSGWCWLIVDAKGKLSISTSPNQDNPIMDIAEINGKPILGIDVWEHAYYLNYQNRRADYLKAFWNIVNWQKVSEEYES